LEYLRGGPGARDLPDRRDRSGIDGAVIGRLASAFDDVANAFRPDGLDLLQFESFGPVRYFRAKFLDGWNEVRGAIAEQRSLVAS